MSEQTMHVVTVTAREQAELLQKPADAKPLEAREVAGRTLVSIISPGTELNSNYVGQRFPSEPGYAAVFEVDQVGSGVTDLKLGERVFCTGPAGIGGHRSRQRCPREAAVLLPAGLSPEVAAHARLMGVSMTTLVTTAARPPEKVLITGLGPVGHLAGQIFRSCGYRVTGVDPAGPRRELAQRMGLGEVLAEVPAVPKPGINGFALALECSGHEQAAVAACKVMRRKGEVVQVGVPWRKNTDLSAHDLLEAVFRGYVTLRSGWEWELPRYEPVEFRTGCIFANLTAALQWLAEGRVRVDGLYRKVSPRDAQQVYQDLLHGRVAELSVLFDWSRIGQ